MRKFIVAMIAVGSVGCAHHGVQFRYSGVYESMRACPLYAERKSGDQVLAERDRWERLWHARGPALLKRVRQVTGIAFPEREVIVYVVSCGRGFSDPVTLAAFAPDGKTSTDDEILQDIVHEFLHACADHPRHAALDARIRAKYAGEDPVALNHVLVAAFEAKIFGYQAVVSTYLRPEYRRAIEIAIAEHLITVP